MTKYRTLFSITALFFALSQSGIGAEQPRPDTVDQAQVVDAIRSMLAALAAEDIPKLRAITAPDFYAFEAGGRITGDALIDLIKKAHAGGKVYAWTVNEPKVHIGADMAWVTYVNRGSIKDASETKNVSWLESAVLRKEEGNWRIQFFHSTRMP